MKVTRACRCCNVDTEWRLFESETKSGARQFGWRCSICNQWQNKSGPGGGFWISQDSLAKAGVDFDSLPFVPNPNLDRCIVCGERGAELHHWAPRSMFEDAEKWPKDYLCKSCHDRWHLVVTPNISFSS